MKTRIIVLSVFLFVIGLNQCFAQKWFPEADRFTASVRDKKNFVELNDGSIIESKKVSYNTPTFGKANFVLDNERKILETEVIAYQLNNEYFRKYEAQDFIVRVIHAKINIYIGMVGTSFDAIGGGKVSQKSYYIQKGDNGKIEFLNAKHVKDIVKDYAPAYDLVKKLANYNNISGKMAKAIAIYNGSN
jgi:hypothetical protein